jgi:hypothetical protein
LQRTNIILHWTSQTNRLYLIDHRATLTSETHWAPCAKSNCYPRVGIVVPKGCYPMALVLVSCSCASKRAKTSRGVSFEP